MSPTKILIASHDAGGAEVLSAWCKKQSAGIFDFLLDGPALQIFKRKFTDLQTITILDAERNATNYSKIITSTSLFSNLERDTIALAKSKNIFCTSVLDHWTQYTSRFNMNSKNYFPDEIWVCDEHAERILKKEIPNIPFQRIENFYLSEIKEESKKYTKNISENVCILYVTEPTSENSIKKFGHPNGYGYNEFDALNMYLNYLVQQNETKIIFRVRPHPSEKKGKYDRIITTYSNLITYDGESKNPLVQDCVWADRIVGCETMAMVVGIILNKQVQSSMPPTGPNISLPFSEIKRIFPKL